LGLVVLLAIAGFWNVYFGDGSNPGSYHHLHVIANFIWLFLLLCQLILIRGNNYKTHMFVFVSVSLAATGILRSGQGRLD